MSSVGNFKSSALTLSQAMQPFASLVPAVQCPHKAQTEQGQKVLNQTIKSSKYCLYLQIHDDHTDQVIALLYAEFGPTSKAYQQSIRDKYVRYCISPPRNPFPESGSGAIIVTSPVTPYRINTKTGNIAEGTNPNAEQQRLIKYGGVFFKEDIANIVMRTFIKIMYPRILGKILPEIPSPLIGLIAQHC